MKINYELIEFPYPFRDGKYQLDITWLDVIHAAITLGRRNWNDITRHADYSAFEIIFRMSMAEAFLVKNPLRVSPAYLTLDPTEKGNINYFSAGIITLIFARKLFDTPYVMHLDVYQRNLYNSSPLHITYRTDERPDFIGIDYKNNYVVFESKGRVDYSKSVLEKAYSQTKSIGRINGELPKWRIGCLAYHANSEYKVKLKDPKDHDKEVYNVKFEKEEFYLNYYSAVFHFVKSNNNFLIEEDGIKFIVTKSICLKYLIGIEKYIYHEMEKALENSVQTNMEKLIDNFNKKEYFDIEIENNVCVGADGIYIKFTK